jgi:hypothetical protein
MYIDLDMAFYQTILFSYSWHTPASLGAVSYRSDTIAASGETGMYREAYHVYWQK